MTDFALRHWALRQAVHVLRRESFDATGLRMAGSIFLNGAILGHLPEESFLCMYGEYPMLDTISALGNTGWLVQLAQARLKETLARGERKSGYLKPYVLAQLAHLGRCVRCQVEVAHVIREDVRLAQDVEAYIAPILDLESPFSQQRRDRLIRKALQTRDDEGE